MKVFIKGFRRNADGSWECIAPATVVGPNGRIEVTPGAKFFPGTPFKGVDLATWLDRQAEKERGLEGKLSGTGAEGGLTGA
jgi:hypothetical protein